MEYRAPSAELVASTNAFSVDLFRRLVEAEGKKNVFVSPLSVALALSMAASGATEGAVRDSMRTALHQTKMGSEEAIQTQFKYMVKACLQAPSDGIQFLVANSAWHKEGEVRADYKELVNEYFGAELLPLSTAGAINSWVSDKTEGLISNLVSVLPDEAVMVLVNTIYFKAAWQHQFNKSNTKEEQFHPSEGDSYGVQMMSMKRNLFYFEEEGRLQMIQLSYGEQQRFCASIILPHPSVTVDDYIQSLTPEEWERYARSVESREGTLFLPRIKLEWGTRSLKGELCAQGMEPAFKSPDAFNRIGDRIFISDVLHKTVLEVDEEGTKAAAATAVLMLRARIVRQSKGPFEMKVDRPFIFAISDKRTRALIFLGKIDRPQ